LRKISIRGGADQEPAGFPARLCGEWTEPGARALAKPKGALGKNYRITHTSVLAALASYPSLAKIGARSTLINIDLSLLACAVGGTLMDEIVPVDIANVARATSPHKTYWDNRAAISVPINILAASKRLAMDQQSGPHTGAYLLLQVLGDEPLWKLKP
jgi:hypothetical protein